MSPLQDENWVDVHEAHGTAVYFRDEHRWNRPGSLGNFPPSSCEDTCQDKGRAGQKENQEQFASFISCHIASCHALSYEVQAYAHYFTLRYITVFPYVTVRLRELWARGYILSSKRKNKRGRRRAENPTSRPPKRWLFTQHGQGFVYELWCYNFGSGQSETWPYPVDPVASPTQPHKPDLSRWVRINSRKPDCLHRNALDSWLYKGSVDKELILANETLTIWNKNLEKT